MISMPTSTKNQYKDFEREISVYGNLYLAKKRLTKNLFNPFTTHYDTNTTTSISNNEIITSSYSSSIGNSNAYLRFPITLKANTDYTFKMKYTRTDTTINGGIGIRTGVSGGTWIASLTGINDASGTKTLTFNSGEYTTLYVWFYLKNASTTQAVDTTFTFTEVMLNEGTTALPFEYYGRYAYDYTEFPLTEENEAKILSFNIDEKCDVYYTSLPYNTMTIEVDNEKGYFTDYDPDSIVNKLNTDCYVRLYIKINNDNYYEIMRMNFDKISYSDYEKARLSFSSSIAKLKNLPLRDRREEDFTTSSWSRTRIRLWLMQNYNISFSYDNNVTTLNSTREKASSVENILLLSGTYYGTLQNAVITTNDTQNNIRLKKWKSTADDTITKDYELEKPIVKRENSYDGVKHTYKHNPTFQQSNETYTRVINGTLTTINEALVVYDNNYKLSTITSSDVTITGNPTLEVSTYLANAFIVILKLTGNIGDEYTITINKDNIYKKISDTLTTRYLGNTNENAKILTINEEAPLDFTYYNLILNEKKIKSYIEAQIIGLPYLELGDAVEIETDNANVLTTISEIEMNFDGGLTMTIKGYELGWDALFPSDTLYPSDDLYPNTPIE